MHERNLKEYSLEWFLSSYILILERVLVLRLWSETECVHKCIKVLKSIVCKYLLVIIWIKLFMETTSSFLCGNFCQTNEQWWINTFYSCMIKLDVNIISDISLFGEFSSFIIIFLLDLSLTLVSKQLNESKIYDQV